jgi:Kef-type K+ transport system membrane component KefB
MLDLSQLLLQLIVILVTARLAGLAVKVLGQPPVIGEMVAGLALGPSFLGALSPATAAVIFPADSLTPLTALSQLGVLLFMFVVGLRLDLQVLRGKARTAVATSYASIALPFAMGAGVATLLFERLAPPAVEFLPFALFLGAAMSVTAFPVLARILAEQNLLGTKIGSVAIASAAVDDVTAWCILAGVVAVARATPDGAGSAGREFLVTLASSGAYVLLMATVGRRLLAHATRRLWAKGTGLSAELVSIAMIVALASAWVTEQLGIHALFGAFLAGTIMPRGGSGDAPEVSVQIADRVEAVVGAVLLPLFFALTGLRTSIGLVDGVAMWGICALIFVVAVAGKLGGSALASRATGLSWRDSLAVGALMNTRGLMELVILNVGLEIGVISPTLFAMLVLMALVTTAMTSPLLRWLLRGERASMTAAT